MQPRLFPLMFCSALSLSGCGETTTTASAPLTTPTNTTTTTTTTTTPSSCSNANYLASPGVVTNLPDLRTFVFNSLNSKTLPGLGSELVAGDLSCTGSLPASETLGCLSVAATFYQNGCYTDGRYNNNDYLVEQGSVTPSDSASRYDAYRIHEPSSKASLRYAAPHEIFYRFPSVEDYDVLRLDGTALTRVAQITAAQIPDTSTAIKVAGVSVSEVQGSAIFLFVPSSQKLSTFGNLGNGVEGARLMTTPVGDLAKYRYSVGGTPYDTASGFAHGPEDWWNIYGMTRQFFLVRRGLGEPGVIWQDKQSNALNLTWMGADLRTPQAVSLPIASNHLLAAATSSSDGTLYYLTVQSGDGSSADSARSATLYKVSATGVQLAMQYQDTSRTGLNIANFGNYVADLKLSGNRLGLMLGRQMLSSADGLNHQGGIAVVYDATTLNMVQNHGQTTGHSFGSVLEVDPAGDFVAIELGDNFPRGINLSRFNDTTLNSKVVYTFKTAHGTTPSNPAGTAFPVYGAISSGGNTFYQWSNDNRTYSELGGVTPSASGYSVVFAGEHSISGASLDNQNATANLNAARNVGLVKVRSDIQNSSASGSVVTDDLVLSSGLPAESGGFYNFTGGWSAQRNAGVVWLTQYSDQTQNNATRVKSAQLPDGNLLVLWESWAAGSYQQTYALTATPTGQVISGPTALSAQVRLNRRDDLYVRDGKAWLVIGDGPNQTLELLVWSLL